MSALISNYLAKWIVSLPLEHQYDRPKSSRCTNQALELVDKSIDRSFNEMPKHHSSEECVPTIRLLFTTCLDRFECQNEPNEIHKLVKTQFRTCKNAVFLPNWCIIYSIVFWIFWILRGTKNDRFKNTVLQLRRRCRSMQCANNDWVADSTNNVVEVLT